MALLFITIGSLLSISLANLSGANLLNTSGFQNQRNSEYAADAAMSEAIQAIRYHGPCESTSSPTLGGQPTSIDGYYFYVSCSGTPITIPVSQFSGSTVTDPSGLSFVEDEVGFEIEFLDSSNNTVGFTKVSAYNSDGSLAVFAGPSSFPGAVKATLFEPRGRLDWLYACVSKSMIVKCDPNAGNPRITAVVHFSDINPSGGSVVGYGLDIRHWDVNTANG